MSKIRDAEKNFGEARNPLGRLQSIGQTTIGFEMDPRDFALVRFPASKGQGLVAMTRLQKALESSLGVRVEAKRDGLFGIGARPARFSYMGLDIAIKTTRNGDFELDLTHIDDEARENLLQQLRLSEGFSQV